MSSKKDGRKQIRTKGKEEMKIFDILDTIWKMPWYKVMVIAVADDVILFLKLWPLYIGVILFFILWYWWNFK